MSDKVTYGESTSRESLPDEVLLRVMRRADAEQNRYISLGRIADALTDDEGLRKHLYWIERSLTRIADALDRAYPEPVPVEDEPDSGE